jgi:hypothetical protein
MDAAVEAVLGLGALAADVLAELEMTVRFRGAPFWVGGECVDPLERVGVAGAARRHDYGRILGDYLAGRREVGLTSVTRCTWVWNVVQSGILNRIMVVVRC